MGACSYLPITSYQDAEKVRQQKKTVIWFVWSNWFVWFIVERN